MIGWQNQQDKRYLKLFHLKDPQVSFGYSQAIKGTWEQYKNETGNTLATRTRFKDSVDFIGWYTDKSNSIFKNFHERCI